LNQRPHNGYYVKLHARRHNTPVVIAGMVMVLMVMRDAANGTQKIDMSPGQTVLAVLPRFMATKRHG
jgi:hypothetical protein